MVRFADSAANLRRELAPAIGLPQKLDRRVENVRAPQNRRRYDVKSIG
jgi:hypothetical protein